METSIEQGLAVRRQVMGVAHVAAGSNADTETNRFLQDFLNENCWGFTWIRPGLTLKDRSLIALVALASGGHWIEFEAHLRGALTNGWHLAELREVVLQAAVYLGGPTAVQAFRALSRLESTLEGEE